MPKIRFGTILLLPMGFICCAALPHKTVDEDGGIRIHSHGAENQKKILSTEIISFECELSLISAVFEEDCELDGRVYKLGAYFENGIVKCSVDWHDRFGNGKKREFLSDVGFMEKLQSIVSEYDLAQYNGRYHVISGLPDMYGAKLDIQYRSGELIYSYDNEECFIPEKAIFKLTELFSSET